MADKRSPQDGALHRWLCGGERTKREEQHSQWTSAITKTHSSPQITTNGEKGQNKKKIWSSKPAKCPSYLSNSLKWVSNWNLWRDFTFSSARAACSWLGWLGLRALPLRTGTAGGLGWLHGVLLFHFPRRGAAAARLPCAASALLARTGGKGKRAPAWATLTLKEHPPLADIVVLFPAARS